MKKALIVTHVSGFVPQFEMNNVRLLQGLGYQVHYATNYNNPTYGTDNHRLDGTGIIRHQIDFVRSPFAIVDNIKVYKQLTALMKEHHFDMIHCHTPMGGAMARLVAHKTNTKPIIYTAHGFHFYKGAPVINWLVYYLAERYLARYTDVIITINQEDYKRAQGFKAGCAKYVPGVGIDTKSISKIQTNSVDKRRELGISENSLVILSAGELIKRKNYITALEAFAAANLSCAVYVICGQGILEKELKEKAKKLGIADKVIFTGYRNDLLEIMKCADVFFFPSFQEGMSVALMEAMACGLPVVCSQIRGNIDLMTDTQGGYMCHPKDTDGFAQALVKLASEPETRKKMGQANILVAEQYDISKISKMMDSIYKACSIKSK